MVTRLFAVGALALTLAGAVDGQEAASGSGTGRQRGNAGPESGAHLSTPASAPTTVPPSSTPGAGATDRTSGAGPTTRPDASPGTPDNPSGLKKPD
jgi:hypothetical protein